MIKYLKSSNYKVSHVMLRLFLIAIVYKIGDY